MKKSITIEQCQNPKFNPYQTVDAIEYQLNKYVYYVKSLKNCMSPAIHTYITNNEVTDLIADGIEVNIIPTK